MDPPCVEEVTSATSADMEERLAAPAKQRDEDFDLRTKIHRIFGCLSHSSSIGERGTVDFRGAVRNAVEDVNKLAAKHSVGAVVTAMEDQCSRLHLEDEEYTIMVLLCLGTLLLRHASIPDIALETPLSHLKKLHEEKHQLNDKYCTSVCNVLISLFDRSSLMFSYGHM